MASLVIPASISIAQLLIGGAAGTFIFNNIGKLVPGFVPQTTPKTSAEAGGVSIDDLIAEARTDIAAAVADGKDTADNAAVANKMLDKFASLVARFPGIAASL